MSMYEQWDKAMAAANPDYESIVKQMLAVAKKMVSVDAELYWRLACALYNMTNNMDFNTDREAILAKTTEAKEYAEKALKSSPGHFSASLLMVKCLGQMIMLTIDDKVAAITMLDLLVYHLATCVRVEPDNWQVLLLESQLQLKLHENIDTLASAAIAGIIPASLGKLMDQSTIEQKLRHVLEQQPKSIEAYFALTECLYNQGKYKEALAIGNEGLKLQQMNKGEEFIASTLRSFLPDVECKAKGEAANKAIQPSGTGSQKQQ